MNGCARLIFLRASLSAHQHQHPQRQPGEEDVTENLLEIAWGKEGFPVFHRITARTTGASALFFHPRLSSADPTVLVYVHQVKDSFRQRRQY